MALGYDLAFMKQLEEKLFDQKVRGTPEALAAILADGFFEFGRSGRAYTKDEIIRSLAAEAREKAQVLSASDYKLTALADDVALLTYRSVGKHDDATERHSLRSSVWKLIDGRWQMVFHQGTPASSSQ